MSETPSSRGTICTAEGFTIGTRERVAAPADAPMLVCLPGGGCTGAYFDVPGNSLLDAAAEAGIDAVALDRPGYGPSDALPAEQTTFARNAEVVDAAIAALWRTHGAGHTGVVLVGHSIGARSPCTSRPWPPTTGRYWG